MNVCFIAPLTGGHRGGVTTQGEILYELFRKHGLTCCAKSDARTRWGRLWDIVRFIIVHRKRISPVVLSVYSGPSFVVADIVARLCRALKIKLVLHLHGGGLPQLFHRKPVWGRRVLARGNVIVVPSRFLQRAVVRMGLDCRIIPNVIELGAYPYRERCRISPRLFWMRSFHPIWNPEMAVRVLAALRSSGESATLVMGGSDKGSLEGIRRLCRELHVDNAVGLPGFLDGAGKADAGNRADVFLNTNRVDNTPVAVLEACAMGLPVISTNVGGIPDLLTEGETGLMVPSDDADAMTRAVVRLLTDPGLASKLSRNGRRLAEASAWPTVRARWACVFEEVQAATI